MQPTHFYKYRPYDEHSASILSKGEVWFSHVADFNDPFDCMIGTHIDDATDAEIMALYLRKIPKREPLLNQRQIQRRAEQFLRRTRRMTPKKHEAESQRRAAEIARKIGVYCLTIHRDNLLMWAHYADKHRGVCFEFDAAHPFFARAEPVCYRPNYPQVDLLDLDDRAALDKLCLRTKSDHWAYEDEYRIIVRYGAGVNNFPQEALTGVVLGCQVTREVRHEIRGLLKRWRPSTQIYRARKAERMYGIVIDKV